MRTKGVFVLALSLGAAVAIASGPSLAAKGKAKGGSGEGRSPSASSSEVEKLRAVRLGDPKAGTFRWGMNPEEVMALARSAVEAKYEARVNQVASVGPGDPDSGAHRVAFETTLRCTVEGSANAGAVESRAGGGH